METGSMDRLIVFQELVPGQRSAKSGQPLRIYRNITVRPEMFASKRIDKGSESNQADKVTAVHREIFKVHYRTDISEELTIVSDSKRWDITNIQELQRRKGLLIHATWTQGQYDYPNDVQP